MTAVLNLARTHAMVYAKKSETAEVAKPLVLPPISQPRSIDQRTVTLPADAPLPVWSHGYGVAAPVYFDKIIPTTDPAKLAPARQHLAQALALYKRAAELAPCEIAFAAAGVRFADGSTRASYDVVLHPAAPRLPL